MIRALDAWIDEQKQNIISDIGNLVAFKSMKERPDEVRGALEYVLRIARDMGFDTEETSCGDVGIIRLSGEDASETVGILTHVDVVGIGDRDKWTDDPFEMKVHDNHIWGRGTVDDKGPVIMSLYAMKALAQCQHPLKRNVQLIVGTCEESQWTDMEHFKEEFPMPDFGFSPDGEFPIYNIEKGYGDVLLSFPAEGTALRYLKAGDSPNTIPSRAEIAFKGENIRCFNGKSAHSSLPELGINAIELLCRQLAKEGREYGFTKFINDMFPSGVHRGSLLEIDDDTDEYGGQYVGATTASATMMNFEENRVIININIRSKYGVDEEHIREAFKKKSEIYGYTFEIVEFTAGMMTDSNQRAFQVMREVMRDYGYEGEFKLAEGASYAATMSNMVSWGPVFLDDFPAAHMEDERMDLDTMMIATKMYAEYLYRICID